MTTSKPKPCNIAILIKAGDFKTDNVYQNNIKDKDSKIIRISILTVLIDHLETWLAGISSQALPRC